MPERGCGRHPGCLRTAPHTSSMARRSAKRGRSWRRIAPATSTSPPARCRTRGRRFRAILTRNSADPFGEEAAFLSALIHRERSKSARAHAGFTEQLTVGRRLRVLVSDDHPLYRDGIARAVRDRLELELVAEPGDGRAALEAIRELSPDV